MSGRHETLGLTTNRLVRKTIIDAGWKKIFESSLGRAQAIRVADGVKQFMTVAILSCVTTTGWAEEPEADPRIDFNIPQQRADLALTEFAEQADLTLAVPRDVLLGKEANALIGSYTLQEGIDVLLAGTGLIPEFSNQIVLSIKTDSESVGEGKTMKSAKKATGLATLLASVFAGGVSAEELGTTNGDGEEFPEELEEIIVTGTNIRGIENSSSPVLTFDRGDIDASGFSTTQQFIDSLPQNFGSGPSEDSSGLISNRDANLNPGAGAGINLRGLGADSTLVLLNGRRLAPGGFGSFTDISLIPLSAIERIEVLTDGASAIYGSDAVGGVVNFVLRDDVDGAQTSFRYGTATKGDRDEFQATQTIGFDWESGNLLLNYEYFDQDELNSDDRDFASFVDTFLLPKTERHGLLISGSQEIGNSLEAFATLSLSDRDALRVLDVPTRMDRWRSESNTQQLFAAGGLAVGLSETWRAELVGAFGVTETNNDILSLTDQSVVADTTINTETWSLDLKADGVLFDLPGGAVRSAIGGQYREETFKPDTLTGEEDGKRDVAAVFGEVLIPIVGETNSRPGFNRLELNAAVRYEDYSDFGSTTNPKVGAVWSPIDGLNLRGSYGTSFRAPLLFELDTSFFTLILADFPDPASMSGTTLALLGIGLGPEPNLGPEKATTWTAGFDFAPDSIPGFNLEFTYFDVDFDNRIIDRVVFFDAFTDPQNASIIVAPVPADIAAVPTTRPDAFVNFTASDPADAVAFVDSRRQNAASTQVSGVDVNLSYNRETDLGDFTVGLNASYLTKFIEQITSSADAFELVDTIFNPVDLSMRGSLAWSRDGLTVGGFINYTDGYEDDQTDPSGKVESWTTFDLTVRYNTGERYSSPWLDNTMFAINVINLFDRDPPFVNDLAFQNTDGLGFDTTNANPLGCFIAFEITKNW